MLTCFLLQVGASQAVVPLKYLWSCQSSWPETWHLLVRQRAPAVFSPGQWDASPADDQAGAHSVLGSIEDFK